MPFEFMTEPTAKKRRFSLFGSSYDEQRAPGRVFIVDCLDFSKFEESVEGFESQLLRHGEWKDIPVDWAFSHFQSEDVLGEFSRLIDRRGFRPNNSYDFWTYRPGDTVYLVTTKEEFDWVSKVTDYNVGIWKISIN